MADLSIFAQRLRVAMAVAEKSPTDMVRAIGVSHQAISNWMRGRAAPRSSHLMTICKLTGCSLDWIMTPEPVDVVGVRAKEGDRD